MMFNQEVCQRIFVGLSLLFNVFYCLQNTYSQLPDPPPITQWGRFRGTFRTNDYRLEQIEQDFRKNMTTVLQNKCLLCHVAEEPFPLFFRLPIANKWLKNQINLGRTQFSFESIHMWSSALSAQNNLKRLQKKLATRNHPSPWFGWVTGEGSLTPLEQNALKSFIEDSLNLLEP